MHGTTTETGSSFVLSTELNEVYQDSELDCKMPSDNQRNHVFHIKQYLVSIKKQKGDTEGQRGMSHSRGHHMLQDT